MIFYCAVARFHHLLGIGRAQRAGGVMDLVRVVFKYEDAECQLNLAWGSTEAKAEI